MARNIAARLHWVPLIAVGLASSAEDFAVSPGFINPHTHDMQSIKTVDGPFLDEQDLAQGSPHARNPVTDFIGSQLETARIGVAAHLPAKLGHIKAVGLGNKGKSAEVIADVNAMRAQCVRNEANLKRAAYPGLS